MYCLPWRSEYCLPANYDDWPFMHAISLPEAATSLVSIKNQLLWVECKQALSQWLLSRCIKPGWKSFFLVLVYYFVKNVRQATIAWKYVDFACPWEQDMHEGYMYFLHNWSCSYDLTQQEKATFESTLAHYKIHHYNYQITEWCISKHL